jgi:hypothetical protein
MALRATAHRTFLLMIPPDTSLNYRGRFLEATPAIDMTPYQPLLRTPQGKSYCNNRFFTYYPTRMG